MIESILGDLLTVFLDILIFNPSHPKTSKKRRLIRFILISLIFIVYLSIFAISLLSSIQFDKTLAIKMGIVTSLLLSILLVFSVKVYNQWKKSQSSN